MLTSLDAAKFWSKVDIRSVDECWPWREGLNEHGYGRAHIPSAKRQYRAHRIALSIADQIAVPDSSVKCLHSCDNPRCCNPHHLRWGSISDNNWDRVIRNRHHNANKTTCKRGHDLAESYIKPSGARDCRLCRKELRLPRLKGRVRGENSPFAKLSLGDVFMIYDMNGSSRAIAAQFGVSHSTILGIKNGKYWKAEIENARKRVIDDSVPY